MHSRQGITSIRALLQFLFCCFGRVAERFGWGTIRPFREYFFFQQSLRSTFPLHHAVWRVPILSSELSKKKATRIFLYTLSFVCLKMMIPLLCFLRNQLAARSSRAFCMPSGQSYSLHCCVSLYRHAHVP